MKDAVTLYPLWTDVLDELLTRTERFPKRVRFTFSSRIDNLGLDVLECIVEARYSRNKTPILHRANLALEKLRVLLSLCHRKRYLDHKGHEVLQRRIDEAGRELGGWLRHQAAR